MDIDSECTCLHTGGSTTEGNRGIISERKGRKDEAQICKLYGKHGKWLAGSYFSKVKSGSKTKDKGKTVQRKFRRIGTKLFRCGGGWMWISLEGKKKTRKRTDGEEI